jgi:hypothetical protein
VGRKLIIVLGLCVVMLFSFSLNAIAAGASDCQTCHSKLDFTAPKINRLQVCKSCHKQGLHAPTAVFTVYGYYDVINFTNPNLTTVQVIYGFSASVLHTKHAGSGPTANGCVGCHGQLNCTACHTVGDPVIKGHEPHSTTLYPRTSAYMALGPGSGLRYLEIQISCINSRCHSTYPNIVDKRTDGQQLCINCHNTPILPKSQGTAKDLSGHNLGLLQISHTANLPNQLTIGGVSKTINCAGCHLNTLTTEHSNKGIECSACHIPESIRNANSVNKAVYQAIYNVFATAGKQSANRACNKCHFNSEVLSQPQEHEVYHLASFVTNGNVLIDVTGSMHANCNTCHDNATIASTVYNLAIKPISARNYDCFTCHNAQYNLAPRHIADLEGELTEITGIHPGCAACHTPGTEYANTVNGIITDLKNEATSYSCSKCHYGASLDTGHIGGIDANCTITCHKSAINLEHLNNPISQAGNTSNPLTCGTCHNNKRIDVIMSIKTGNGSCIACHNHGHNFSIGQQLPIDIPLYTGLTWGIPQQASIWADEIWMPDGYEGGKLIISSRSKTITAAGIWSYYNSNMDLKGWIPPALAPDTTGNFFSAEFTKGNRKATIFFYGGENHCATPLTAGGYRIEILYN